MIAHAQGHVGAQFMHVNKSSVNSHRKLRQEDMHNQPNKGEPIYIFIQRMETAVDEDDEHASGVNSQHAGTSDSRMPTIVLNEANHIKQDKAEYYTIDEEDDGELSEDIDKLQQQIPNRVSGVNSPPEQ